MNALNFELFDLKWHVSLDGYQITSTRKGRKVREVTTILGNKGEIGSERELKFVNACGLKTRSITPLKQHETLVKYDLAREFVGIIDDKGTLDEGLVLGFANKYGLLGLNNIYQEKGIPKKEDLSGWTYWAKNFKQIYTFVDQYKTDGNNNLSRTQAMTLFNTQIETDTVNIKIQGSIKKYGWHPTIAPRNLISAMRILLMKEITGEVNIASCKAPKCSNWFPYRKSKQYCCTPCRVAGNRKKKQEKSGTV